MAARKTAGLELGIKPSSGVIQTCGTSSAPGIPKQPWHLWWHNPCGSKSITFPAGVGSCFHPSPRRKKSLIQAIENIGKSNYLPRALPGAVPPALLPPLPASRLSPAWLFPGAHTKGWMQALLGSSFTHSNSAASMLPASAPPERQGAHLQPWGGW